MQYVNDDMDELFRRAAENYPLDTNGADWNKVLAAMQGQAESKTISEKKRNKNGRFLWLLLLLPLGLICNQLYSPGSLNDKGISKTKAGKEVLKENKNIPEQNEVRSSERINNTNDNSIVNSNKVNATDFVPDKLNVEKASNNTFASATRLSKTSYSSKATPSKRKARSFMDNTDIFSRGQNQDGVVRDNDFIENETLFARSYISGIGEKQLEEFSTAVNRKLNPLFNSQQQSRQKIRIEKSKKFYAGLMGAVDATTIKFQKIEDAGSSYGLLLGYNLNKKWSIETGVYLENKYYYSDGNYFTASKFYTTPNTRIDNVSGDCKMFDIPVSIKYNFSSRKNSGWFAMVGSSSYFMKKESYTYDAYYGSIGPVQHHKEFKNSSTNLFSTINVSGGYAHRLGNVADLRVEPYIKMPISRMGVGSLPFFSTGIQLGLTRKF